MVLWATGFGTILKFILIAYGHGKDRLTPVSFPLAIQDMPYVVLCTGLEHPSKMEEKLSQHDFASYTAKRHLSVSAGLLVVFATFLHAFLGSYMSSFGTELLIAALSHHCTRFKLKHTKATSNGSCEM